MSAYTDANRLADMTARMLEEKRMRKRLEAEKAYLKSENRLLREKLSEQGRVLKVIRLTMEGFRP